MSTKHKHRCVGPLPCVYFAMVLSPFSSPDQDFVMHLFDTADLREAKALLTALT